MAAHVAHVKHWLQSLHMRHRPDLQCICRLLWDKANPFASVSACAAINATCQNVHIHPHLHMQNAAEVEAVYAQRKAA